MPEEPCQCPDCQRFYREHDRLIRENPSLRQQQELSWAALQSFRTLAGRVLEELQKQHGDGEAAPAPGSAPAPEAQAATVAEGEGFHVRVPGAETLTELAYMVGAWSMQTRLVARTP